MFRDRYDFIKKATGLLVQALELQEQYPPGFDVVNALVDKVGGYNCGLEGILKNIESRPLAANIYRAPWAGKRLLTSRVRVKELFEFPVGAPEPLERRANGHAYRHVMFASLNQYLTSLTHLAHDMLARREGVVLVIPRVAEKWTNYSLVEATPGLEVVFLEQLLPPDYHEEASRLSSQLQERLSRHRRALEMELSYRAYRFGPALYPVIERFATTFIPHHLLVTKYLAAFLPSVSTDGTTFYIARGRRAAEGSFVQIGNALTGETVMAMHGLLSRDLELRLFTGSFRSVKTVHASGQHDRDAILYRQRELGEPAPDVVIRADGVFRKIAARRPRTGPSVLFTVESATRDYIRPIAERLPPDIQLKVRLHPESRSQLPRLRFSKANVEFDDLSGAIEEQLETTNLVITYASTTGVQALYNYVPTLLIDFPELKKKQPPILREGVPADGECSVMYAPSIDVLVDSVERFFRDSEFAARLVAANRIVANYFVGSEEPGRG